MKTTKVKAKLDNRGRVVGYIDASKIISLLESENIDLDKINEFIKQKKKVKT